MTSLAGQKCEDCDAPAEHRHHEDYSKPRETVNLCRTCHVKRHTDLREPLINTAIRLSFQQISALKREAKIRNRKWTELIRLAVDEFIETHKEAANGEAK